MAEPKDRKLPRQLSALLRIAVADAKAVQRRKRFRLDMDIYCSASTNGSCWVCLAGPVMVQSLGLDPRRTQSRSVWPNQTNYEVELHAIEYMRVGRFDRAFKEIYCGLFPFVLFPFDLVNIGDRVAAARNDRLGRASWSVYLAAARELEALGL